MSDDKIIPFRGVTAEPPAVQAPPVDTGFWPTPNVVSVLEGLLVAARSGQISGIAVAAVGVNNSITSTWTHDGACGSPAMLSAITALNIRYQDAFLEQMKAEGLSGG